MLFIQNLKIVFRKADVSRLEPSKSGFLDEKEADENLMSYVCIDSKDVDKLKKFYEIEKKYLNFFQKVLAFLKTM